MREGARASAHSSQEPPDSEGDPFMPPSLSKPSSAAPAALIYITLGALLTVWSVIW